MPTENDFHSDNLALLNRLVSLVSALGNSVEIDRIGEIYDVSRMGNNDEVYALRIKTEIRWHIDRVNELLSEQRPTHSFYLTNLEQANMVQLRAIGSVYSIPEVDLDDQYSYRCRLRNHIRHAIRMEAGTSPSDSAEEHFQTQMNHLNTLTALLRADEYNLDYLGSKYGVQRLVDESDRAYTVRLENAIAVDAEIDREEYEVSTGRTVVPFSFAFSASTGEDLDRIGNGYVTRELNESDHSYRRRVKIAIRAIASHPSDAEHTETINDLTSYGRNHRFAHAFGEMVINNRYVYVSSITFRPLFYDGMTPYRTVNFVVRTLISDQWNSYSVNLKLLASTPQIYIGDHDSHFSDTNIESLRTQLRNALLELSDFQQSFVRSIDALWVNDTRVDVIGVTIETNVTPDCDELNFTLKALFHTGWEELTTTVTIPSACIGDSQFIRTALYNKLRTLPRFSSDGLIIPDTISARIGRLEVRGIVVHPYTTRVEHDAPLIVNINYQIHIDGAWQERSTNFQLSDEEPYTPDVLRARLTRLLELELASFYSMLSTQLPSSNYFWDSTTIPTSISLTSEMLQDAADRMVENLGRDREPESYQGNFQTNFFKKALKIKIKTKADNTRKGIREISASSGIVKVVTLTEFARSVKVKEMSGSKDITIPVLNGPNEEPEQYTLTLSKIELEDIVEGHLADQASQSSTENGNMLDLAHELIAELASHGGNPTHLVRACERNWMAVDIDDYVIYKNNSGKAFACLKPYRTKIVEVLVDVPEEVFTCSK